MYDFKLCHAILAGFRDQLRSDGIYKDGFIGMHEERSAQEPVPILRLTGSDGSVLNVRVENEPVFKDDLTGQLLPPDLGRSLDRRSWITSMLRLSGIRGQLVRHAESQASHPSRSDGWM